MLGWGKEKKASKRQEAAKRQAPATTPTRQGTARTVSADAPSSGGAAPGGRTLEEVLVEAGTITQDQLNKALAKQKETGAFLGQVLVDLGFIDENSLTSFLAKYCKIPHLSLLDYLIDQSQLSLVPRDVCLRYRLLPIDRLGKNLTVAMVNPLNQEALETVRGLCPDLRIKPILCAWNHYQAVTRRLFNLTEEQIAELCTTLPTTEPAQEEAAVETPPVETPEMEEVAPPVSAEPAEPEAVAAETPEPAAPEPEPAAPEAPLDQDAVLNEVFKAEEETPPLADEKAPAPAASPADKEGTGSIMQEMISVMRDSMRDTYAMLARRMELFRGLNPEVVARIFAKGMTLEFDAGRTIFEKGDKSEELYAILGGRVDIMDGDRRVATLSRGDMFGEMALISNEPRSATAIAIETTSVLALTFNVFDTILPKEAAIQLLVNIVVTLSDRLRDANNYINTHLK